MCNIRGNTCNRCEKWLQGAGALQHWRVSMTISTYRARVPYAKPTRCGIEQDCNTLIHVVSYLAHTQRPGESYPVCRGPWLPGPLQVRRCTMTTVLMSVCSLCKYVCIYIYIYICLCVLIYVCMYVCMNVCVCVYVCINVLCIYVWMKTYAYMHEGI